MPPTPKLNPEQAARFERTYEEGFKEGRAYLGRLNREMYQKGWSDGMAEAAEAVKNLRNGSELGEGAYYDGFQRCKDLILASLTPKTKG